MWCATGCASSAPRCPAGPASSQAPAVAGTLFGGAEPPATARSPLFAAAATPASPAVGRGAPLFTPSDAVGTAALRRRRRRRRAADRRRIAASGGGAKTPAMHTPARAAAGLGAAVDVAPRSPEARARSWSPAAGVAPTTPAVTPPVMGGGALPMQPPPPAGHAQAAAGGAASADDCVQGVGSSRLSSGGSAEGNSGRRRRRRRHLVGGGGGRRSAVASTRTTTSASYARTCSDSRFRVPAARRYRCQEPVAAATRSSAAAPPRADQRRLGAARGRPDQQPRAFAHFEMVQWRWRRCALLRARGRRRRRRRPPPPRRHADDPWHLPRERAAVLPRQAMRRRARSAPHVRRGGNCFSLRRSDAHRADRVLPARDPGASCARLPRVRPSAQQREGEYSANDDFDNAPLEGGARARAEPRRPRRYATTRAATSTRQRRRPRRHGGPTLGADDDRQTSQVRRSATSTSARRSSIRRARPAEALAMPELVALGCYLGMALACCSKPTQARAAVASAQRDRRGDIPPRRPTFRYTRALDCSERRDQHRRAQPLARQELRVYSAGRVAAGARRHHVIVDAEGARVDALGKRALRRRARCWSPVPAPRARAHPRDGACPCTGRECGHGLAHAHGDWTVRVRLRSVAWRSAPDAARAPAPHSDADAQPVRGDPPRLRWGTAAVWAHQPAANPGTRRRCARRRRRRHRRHRRASAAATAAFFRRSQVCKKLGDSSKAMVNFTRALDLSPKDARQIKRRSST